MAERRDFIDSQNILSWKGPMRISAPELYLSSCTFYI